MSKGNQENRAANSAGSERPLRFHSSASLLTGIACGLIAVQASVNGNMFGSVTLGWIVGATMGLGSLYLLVLEFFRPLIVLGADGIRVRERGGFKVTEVAWEQVREVKPLHGRTNKVAVLEVGEGREVQVPVGMVLLPRPARVFELIRQRGEGVR